MEFIWDEAKREKVSTDHKVDFAKIPDVFDDSFAVYFDDYEHSDETEIRPLRTNCFGLYFWRRKNQIYYGETRRKMDGQ